MGRNFENRKQSIFKTAAQKSKLYAKYGKQLYMAAKNGVPDPDANPTLRSIVEKAKRENVPSHVIEKAIQKARARGARTSSRRVRRIWSRRRLSHRRLFDRQQSTDDLRSPQLFHQDRFQVGRQWLRRDVVRARGRPLLQGRQRRPGAGGHVQRGRRRRRRRKQRRLHHDLRPACRVLQSQDGRARGLPGVEWKPRRSPSPAGQQDAEREDLSQFEKFLEMLHECDDVQDIYHNVAFPS